MLRIIVILLLIVSVCTTDDAIKRKKSSNTRRVDQTMKTRARLKHDESGRVTYRTRAGDSNRYDGDAVDDSSRMDYSNDASEYERFENKRHSAAESQNSDDEHSNSRRDSHEDERISRRRDRAKQAVTIRTVDSSGATKDDNNDTERDITFEDFNVKNEDLRDYVNKLRKRIARLQRMKTKFGKVHNNYVLRHRMDVIETTYLNNIKFIEENQDYNRTLLKLIPTFNDKRKAEGWKQMVNVSQITVGEVVKSEARKDRLVYHGLPKTFLTRYEKWYAGTEWLQNLSPERVRQLRVLYSVVYRVRENILEQFQERPISSSDVAAGMDNLYGIISTNVKSCLEISNLEMRKILKIPLISYNKQEETVSKCANVLTSLKEII